MTEGRRRAPARSGGTAAALSWLAAACAFVIVLALLSWQMAHGRDPALGEPRPAAAAAAAVPQPRRVVIRRIERTIIVTRVLPPRPAAVIPTAAPAPYVPPQPAAYAPPARPAYTPPPRVVQAAPAPPPHAVTRAS
jgi:hypothetical protein